MRAVVFAAAFLFLLTRPFQWPPKSDAENYVEVSGSLLRGEGFINAPPYQDWNTYYVEWTPLYPLILAGIRLTGIDLHVGIRMLHAACYALTVMLVWQSLKRWRWPLTLALFTPAFTYVYGFAYSEAVFNLLVVAFLLMLFREPPRLLILAVIAALAVLQRYSGLALIVTGGLYLLWRWGWRPALAFVLLPSVSIGGWMLRNYALTGAWMGQRPPAWFTWEQNIYAARATLGEWIGAVMICFAVGWIIERLYSLCSSWVTRRLSSTVPARPPL